jgi:outer membrane biosynthesis protein TonB
MKLAGVIGTTLLSLTLGASSAAYAQDQHEQQEEQKDKPTEKKAQAERPAKPEEKNAQEEKNTKPEEKNAQQRAPEAKPAQHAGAGRIPADRYKANFGREHTFRVSQGDFRSGRFQYGGYWSDSVEHGPATGSTRKTSMWSRSTVFITCATRCIRA